MSHSLNRIWIHAVWATKYRQPILSSNIEQKVFEFIKVQLLIKGCPVKIINGMPDHIHCLFLLSPQKSTSQIIKQIKGSSASFINQNQLSIVKFAWQTGYGCFSVSEFQVETVYRYIKNQKQHHRKKSSHQEYGELKKIAENS